MARIVILNDAQLKQLSEILDGMPPTMIITTEQAMQEANVTEEELEQAAERMSWTSRILSSN